MRKLCNRGWAVLIALFGTAGCGGKVATEQDPDASLGCTPGSLYAIISGKLDGTPIDTRFNLTSAGLGGNGDQWSKHWTFIPLGHASATGVGARGDEIETSMLLVTPQGPPFEGAIFTASARFRLETFEPATLTALRRVGWCPGSPIDGDLTYEPYAPECPAGAPQPECALLEGRLDRAPVKEFGQQIYNTQFLDDAGVRAVRHELENGGLILVEWSPENAAGVIAFPETSANKAVLCVERLADRPTDLGGFHATALSLAGERPGEPVSGELSIRTCLP